MSDRVYSDYIDDIVRSTELILEFTAGLDCASFVKDNKTAYAVVRCFEIMGEAAKKVPDDIRSQYSDIPWKLIAGMRDRLIHGYDVVDNNVIWRTVVKDVPALLEKLKRMKKG